MEAGFEAQVSTPPADGVNGFAFCEGSQYQATCLVRDDQDLAKATQAQRLFPVTKRLFASGAVGEKARLSEEGNFREAPVRWQGETKRKPPGGIGTNSVRRANSNGLRKKLLEARASESGEGGDIYCMNLVTQ